MRLKRVDALLVLNMRNIRYLTDFTGSSAFMLVARERTFFFTDFRYKEQAENEVKYSELGFEKGKRIPIIGNLIKKVGIKVLGFEASISFDFYDALRRLPITLTPLSGLIEQLRLVKDHYELEKIKEAIQRAQEAFIATKPRIKSGVTERAVALRLEEELKKKGMPAHTF